MKHRRAPYVDTSKVRSDEMRKVYEDLEARGICPFCAEHRDEHLTGARVMQTDHWIVTYNNWPYDHTDLHLMITCNYHAEHFSDLRPGSFEDLGDILKQLEKQFHFNHGGFVGRFGNVLKTGASVAHLHFHVIIPDEEAVSRDNDIKVKFKISP